MPPNFESVSYWHDRFTHETSFEWLVPSQTFLSAISPVMNPLPRSARILHLGSGTSDLHAHLRRLGFTQITNLDYEPLALKRGQQLEVTAFGDVKCGYAVADVTDLQSFVKRAGRWDLVIDKSTVDAISCGGKDPLRKMVEGVRKCLTPGGIWVSLSYSGSWFELDGLKLGVEVLARIPLPRSRETDPDIFYWCYVLRP